MLQRTYAAEKMLIRKLLNIFKSVREHYQGYRKNPNDKIYMMMNRKDVKAYQKSYEAIGYFP
jgi:hypothetical protein